MSLAKPNRIAAIALAALLTTLGWSGSAARAADDSNIPGIPLPGSVVTGLLGGPVYDHVYALDVDPNSVILASLTGSAGTDFDLYLFDSSATTVYATQGQVATSTGSGSTESITYPTPGGGRFYIDLNGASDAEGSFRLSVSILRDTVSPEATLLLNGGDAATNQETVTVTLVGTDNLSGVDQMQLSTDGFNWQPLVQYTPTVLWTFSSDQGDKELWGRVRDRAGNVSAAAHALIRLDTTPPRVVASTPAPGGTVAGLRPTLTVTFDEPIRPSSWLDNGLIVQRANGGVVAGAFSWNAATRTGSFTPSADLQPGEQVTVQVGSVVDLAGNAPISPAAWDVRVLLQHVVTLGVSQATVTAGASVRLSGRVDTVLGSIPVLEESVAGAAWTSLRLLHPDVAGAFAETVSVGANTLYRVRVAGSPIELEAISPSVRVIARRGLTLAGSGPSIVRKATVGRTVSLVAQVTPATPNVVVTVTVSRYDASARKWVTAATLKKGTSAGKATFSWRPTIKGSYTVRATTPSGTTFANSVTGLYRYTVS